MSLPLNPHYSGVMTTGAAGVLGWWALFAFWLGVAWIVYVYLGYPLVLAVLGLWRRISPSTNSDFLPAVSVLIAARNEEKDIAWKIHETLSWDYPADRLQVLVASDASEDSTDNIVRSIDDPRLTFLRLEERGGKNRALNRLAIQATGEILFFTDANAHIEPQAIRRLVRQFADPRVGCVTGHSVPIGDEESPVLSSGAGVYWGYESLLQELEDRIGSVLVCDGAIFCLRAGLYHQLSPELANDLELPMRAGAAGFWVRYERDAVVFERETSSPRQEFDRRRRICSQGMLALLRLPGVLRGLRRWQFVSHKLLRWLTLVPMLLLFAAAIVLARTSTAFLMLLALQIAFYGMAALGLACAAAGRSAVRPLAVSFYAMLGVSGALVGVIEAFLGKRFDVWDIPSLSRGISVRPLPGKQAAE